MSEVSPYNSQMESISAAVVHDGAGQLLASVKGAYTAPVDKPHKMEGLSMDQKPAEILTITQIAVVKDWERQSKNRFM